jgi:hypothetical protein
MWLRHMPPKQARDVVEFLLRSFYLITRIGTCSFAQTEVIGDKYEFALRLYWCPLR